MPTLSGAFRNPIITPLNNALYNSDAINLAQHGTHPFYQHFLINIPQLLGPALLLLIHNVHSDRSWTSITSTPVASALVGTAVLSIVPHQEARFLLPAIPLLLTAIHSPRSRAISRIFLYSWIAFNLSLGTLMGHYHQAGVIPAQMWLEHQSLEVFPHNTTVFWWKTYSPPTWLLNGRNVDVDTVDLMGYPKERLEDRLCDGNFDTPRLLVAPRSATFLDQFVRGHSEERKLNQRLVLTQQLWSTKAHLNLDDMDFGDDGFLPTLSRVVGRRGLIIWRAECQR